LCGVKLCLTINLIILKKIDQSPNEALSIPIMIGTYLMKKNGTP
jgi:hypothetical protein